MRISLTALTARGPRDVMINGDSELTVEGVARSLSVALRALQVEEPSLAQVVPHPAATWPPPATAGGLWMNGRLLDPSAPAVRTLRDGAVVTTDAATAPATVLDEPVGTVEIRVVGGPVAGTVHRLGLGSAVLGSSADTDVRLADPSIPPRSLRLTIERDRVVVEPSNNTQATLDREPLTDPAVWAPGSLLAVGSSVLTHVAAETPDAHLEPLAEGGLAYNRPPRILPAQRPKRLEVPRRPVRNDRQRLRLFGALLFSAFGLVMAFALHQWWWGLFALSWPVVQVGEWIGDRMHGRKSYKKALREYEEKSRSFGTEVRRLCSADERERRAFGPDPAEVLLTATGPRRRLWERRPGDFDALRLRLGLADLPASIELVGLDKLGEDEPRPKKPRARDVPVALPLGDLGIIGLTGDRSASRGLARWLVAQAATLHSPRDLAIVVLSADADGAEHWNWVRWLPHCAPREGEECVALVGADQESVARRVTELAIRITERRRASSVPLEVSERPYDILVVLDGARALRRVPGMPQVLSRGPEYGLYAICVDDDERTLPEECRVVTSWEWENPAAIRMRGEGLEAVGPVLADQVSVAWCERLARALAPVRDVSREDSSDGLPETVRLLDLPGMPADPTAERILAGWSASSGRSTMVPVGIAADGVFSIDLVRDGPHGLVAGTTGSGKSELLQTLIAGLAVVNRPDEMTFVLIDYKGGAAFKDCAGLPHTVGMVTDLDGHLTQRALASLAAELRRREELLLQAGAKDIEDYLELRDRSPGVLEALPRLLIVIDEFAALASELPDFVAGLVDIGRRGRSLGVHLLLATQRPAGVVTAEIRANTNLRIALRVTDTDESTDVLETPDAARISKATPGRCFVRSGTATPQAVQSARIGGRRPGTAGSGPSSAAVQFLTWTSLGRPLAEPVASLSPSVQTPHPSSLQTTHPSSLQTTHPSSSQAPHPSSSQATRRDGANGAAEAGGGNPGAGWNVAGRRRAEGAWGAEDSWGTEAASEAGPGVGTGLGAGVGTGLGAGVGTGLGAGEEEGLVTDLAVLVRAVREAAGRAGIPSVPSPWLDPLPDELVLSPRQAAGGSVTEVPPIVFGVTDLPEAQSRGPLSLDLATSGHIYVAGAARSGRSTALRSLAGALAASCSPYDVHLYAIDCGANALLPLVALPHCGAVVGRDQLDRTERLITALATEVSRRQQLLAEAGFASLAEQRRSAPSAERLPWMVLLLDRWEGFVGAFEHYDYGRLVTAILQLLREGAAVGLRAVFAGDRSGLGGQVSTVFDRRLVLRMADPADYGYAGFNERQVPADMPPGRVLELRTVGKGGGPLRESQIGLLSDDTSGTGQVATVHALAKLCQDRYGRLPRALRPMHVDELPVRVGYDEALALEPDFLPPSSLWALVGVGRDDLSPVGIDLMADGPGFVIGGPARSGRSTALRTIAHSLLDPAIAGGLVPVVVIAPRRSPLRLLAGRPGVLGVLDATATADDLEDLLEHEHRYVILVDDAELLDETELDDALAKQLRSARDGEHAVVIAGTTQDIGRGYRGFLSDTRRSRSGLLLDIDSPDDGDLLGLRLPRNANYGGPTGRALFVASGVQTQIQVALPPSATDDYR